MQFIDDADDGVLSDSSVITLPYSAPSSPESANMRCSDEVKSVDNFRDSDDDDDGDDGDSKTSSRQLSASKMMRQVINKKKRLSFPSKKLQNTLPSIALSHLKMFPIGKKYAVKNFPLMLPPVVEESPTTWRSVFVAFSDCPALLSAEFETENDL